MNKIFPIRIYADDQQKFVYELHQEFKDNRPKDMSYYAYDVTIHSETTVEFNVRTMHDNVYGGVGGVIGQFMVTNVNPEKTKPLINRRIRDLAIRRYDEELHVQKEMIIQNYMRDEWENLKKSVVEES